MRRLLSLIVIIISTVTAFGETVYIDDFSGDSTQGRFVIESENYTSRSNDPNTGWYMVDGTSKKFLEGPYNGQLAPTRPNNARENFMEAMGSNPGGEPISSGYNGPVMKYKIHVETPGQYRLFVKWNGRDGASDSLYAYFLESDDTLFIDGGLKYFTFHQYARRSDWKWDYRGVKDSTYVSGVGYPDYADWNIITPGVYTIAIAMRERKAAVDTIVLQTKNLSMPSYYYDVVQSDDYDDESYMVDMVIAGPNNVSEDSNQQYKAIGIYDDGSEKDITGKCQWYSTDCRFAWIDANGLFMTDMAIYLHQDCKIYADYAIDEVNILTAEKTVAIRPICPSKSALSFDGVDDYVDLGTNLDMTEFTWSIWFKRNEITYLDERALISNTGSKNTRSSYGLQIDVGQSYQDRIQFVRHGDVIQNTLHSNKVINDTDWHNVVVTRVNSGYTVLYIDGVLDAQGVVGERRGYSNTVIAAGNSNYSNFSGLIDEVAIFNRALTLREIKHNMHYKLTGNESGLVGYWDFEEGVGHIAHDKSGNGNHGRIITTSSLIDPNDPERPQPDWITPGAPFICTMDQLAKRNIRFAKDIKRDVLEELNYAIAAEKAAGEMLAKLQLKYRHNIYKMVNILRTRISLRVAVIYEFIATKKIRRSIKSLSQALDFLNNEPLPRPQQDARGAGPRRIRGVSSIAVGNTNR